MKTRGTIKMGIFGMLTMAFFVLFSFAPRGANAHPGACSSSYNIFYDELSPYGIWFNDPAYGMVWSPNVEPGFRPYYTNGYWVNTNVGNMWVSDYVWGWAPFHYGRWTIHDRMGWIWIPGNTWGPAWVTWRTGGGYYGWAPMGPGVTINISFGAGYRVPHTYWTFIPYNRLYHPHFYNYYVPSRNVTIINHTTLVNNTYIYEGNTYVTGPSRRDYKAATGQDLRTYDLNLSAGNDRRSVINADNSRVAVYKPESVGGTANRRDINAATRNPAADGLRTNSQTPTDNSRREGNTTRGNTSLNRATETGNSVSRNRETGLNNKPTSRVQGSVRNPASEATKTPAVRADSKVSTPAEAGIRNSGSSSRNTPSTSVRTSTPAKTVNTPSRTTTPSNATGNTPTPSVRTSTPAKTGSTPVRANTPSTSTSNRSGTTTTGTRATRR